VYLIVKKQSTCHQKSCNSFLGEYTTDSISGGNKGKETEIPISEVEYFSWKSSGFSYKDRDNRINTRMLGIKKRGRETRTVTAYDP
jgi:hypothetical protein